MTEAGIDVSDSLDALESRKPSCEPKYTRAADSMPYAPLPK